MKHTTSTTANGLCTPPCDSSHGNLSSFRFRNSLLMLFLLLFVGSNAAWGRTPTIFGEGLPGLNTCSDCGNWDSNTKVMQSMGENGYWYAEFLNVAATDNNKYRFKIAINDGTWWDGAMNSGSTNESMGNVDIVNGKDGDNQISFKMPFDGDVYIFYKSTNADNSKVWIVAVPKNVAAAPNNSNNRRLKTDIILKESSNDWTSDGIKFAKNDVATTYKHVTSYIMPAKKSTETGAIRFEMKFNDDTYISGKSEGRPATLSNSTPRRIIYLWDGNNNGSWIAYTLPTYPVRKSGWKLFVKDYNSGNPTTMDANGSATLTLNGGSSYEFFIANTEDATNLTTYSTSAAATYPAVHSVNWFGGCYVDKSNSSNVTFNDIQVYKSEKFGTLTHPVVDSHHLQGKFLVSGSGAKDVTFSFDGGTITINAVDHVESFTDEVYVYGAGGTNWVTGWSKPVEDYKMTISGGVASKTFYNVKGNGLNFKVWNKTTSSDIDWSKYDSSQSDVTCTNCSSNNICFDLAQNSDVTVYTDGEKVWVKVQARQTITSDYYLQGDYNGWHTWTDAYKFTKVDNYTQRITKRWSPSDFTTCAGLSRCKILKSDDDWGNAITINGIHAETSSYTSQTDCEGGDTRICVKLTQTSDVTYTIWKNSNGDKKVSINVVPVVVRTVTFNTDGGSSIDNANVENGQTVTRPSDPSKGGYAFVNWYSDSEKTVLYDFGTPVTADITLYAKWEAAETRRITFVTNGGTAVDPVDLTKGTKLSSYPSTSYGNGTVTWCTDEGLTTAFDKDNTNINEDITLYAKWGVSGNFYLVGDFGMHDYGTNWAYNSSMTMETEDGVASVTFIAPKGCNRFEILTSRSSWPAIANQGSGLIAPSTPTLNWGNGYGPDSYDHFYFELDAPKKVTIRYNGKVSVTAEDYDVVKDGWTVVCQNLLKLGNVANDHVDNADDGNYMNGYNMTAGEMDNNGELIIRDVEADTYKFWIGKHNTALNKQKQQIEVFGAAHVDVENSSLGTYGSLANINNPAFNRNIPQDDRLYRRVQFTLTQKADIKIAFDGGKITVNVLPTHTVTFKNGETTFTTAQVFDGNVATAPASNPEKAGHEFTGWDWNFTTPITGDQIINAQFSYKPIESVSLNESTHMTWVGNTDFTLTPTYDPSDLIVKDVAWSSNNTSVATVSDGTVHVEAGAGITEETVVRITCTVTDQYDVSRSAYCDVTVAPCQMTTDNLYSMNVTGYNSSTGNSATLIGLWNSSEPATITVCNVRIGNEGTPWYAYDNSSSNENTNGSVLAEQRSNADVDKWQMIAAGTTNSIPVYYLKNMATGKYMFRESSNDNSTTNSAWYTRAVKTSKDKDNSDFYKFYSATDTWGNDVIVSLAGATSNSLVQGATDYVLSREHWVSDRTWTWTSAPEHSVAAARGSNEGGNNYKGFQSSFVNIDNEYPNPAYIPSQMNSSYYRMNTNATVQANLAAALVKGAVITVSLYADAATSVKLQKTDGTEIETINLTADAERVYTYAGSALVGESAFVIKASDNHAGIASIVVTRTYAASPSDPALEWETDLSGGVTQSALGGMFQHVASSTLSSGAIRYSSSDETVATVTADGTVTPLKAGSTTITATIEAEGCYAEAYIPYNVTLTEPSLQEAIDATAASGTLVLTRDYAEDAIINKAITIDGGGHAIRNLTVEMAGDLTLSSTLTVNDFSIYAKAGNTTTPAASGQVRNATNLTANGNAYFYYTVDPSEHVQYGWYDFTVPFRVNVMTGIKGIQEGVLKENFVNETDYAIMEHLGEKQAAGEYAYKKFRGVMEPCRLYSITLDPRNNYNTIRYQKADGDLVAGNSVTLNTYASTVDDKHANWNGVGNGTLHHADAGLSVATIQVYQSGNKTFLPVDRAQYSLVIGSAFMVQQTGTMMLNQATHSPLLAPKRAASVQPTAIQIASEGQPFSDQLFISADEMAGQGYTQGVDVAKAGNIGNVNVPQIWTNAYNSKLCAHEAQLINGEAQYALSLYAPANGSYTLTSKNIPDGYTLYLTQNGNRIWDLSERYVLDLTKGTATEFGLLLVENYKMPTAVENIGSQADETQKIMHNGILYILRNGKVFNAQGARVK